jgi:hypothetical protein
VPLLRICASATHGGPASATARLGRDPPPASTAEADTTNVIEHFPWTLLAIPIFHLQQHLVLLYTELGLLPHGQQDRMFFVPGANAVNYAVALQEVFLAEQSVTVGTDVIVSSGGMSGIEHRTNCSA